MFEENKYLGEIFGEIVKKVVENLIKTKENAFEEQDFGSLDSSALHKLREIIKEHFETKIGYSPLANRLSTIIRDNDLNNLGDDIDFSNEINCLTCVHYIFKFFISEHDFYNFRDGCLTFDKDKKDSMLILEKKNAILTILIKCVDNFSIDQELKERAKKMIQNAAKYNRASFLTEEREDIEAILKSLKFRLNNMIKLEKHDVLDKLILDDTLPDDIDRSSINKELITKNKSELVNIVSDMYNSISDYIKEPQFNIIDKSNINSIEIDYLKEDPTNTFHYLLNQSQFSRPLKAKNMRKPTIRSIDSNSSS